MSYPDEDLVARMSPTARRLWKFGTTFFLVFLLIFLLTPNTVHRRAFDRAFYAYWKNPTPEAHAEMEHQRSVNLAFKALFDAAGSLILVSVGLATFVTTKRTFLNIREKQNRR